MEHINTIRAMENPAVTYHTLEKYTQAEKLKIEVLDARSRILGVEHLDTFRAISNLAVKYHSLGKYTEAEKLEIQAQRVLEQSILLQTHFLLMHFHTSRYLHISKT